MVAKLLERWNLVNMVWGLNPTGVKILNMIQASLAICCECATGLHIVGREPLKKLCHPFGGV